MEDFGVRNIVILANFCSLGLDLTLVLSAPLAQTITLTVGGSTASMIITAPPTLEQFEAFDSRKFSI